MNTDNLMQFGRDKPPLSNEQAVKQGRRGGKASGKARRDIKNFRDALQVALAGKYTVNGKKLTGYEAIAQAVIENAIKGDIRAFTVIRDTVEGKPTINATAYLDENNEATGITIQIVDASGNAIENTIFSEGYDGTGSQG